MLWRVSSSDIGMIPSWGELWPPSHQCQITYTTPFNQCLEHAVFEKHPTHDDATFGVNGTLVLIRASAHNMCPRIGCRSMGYCSASWIHLFVCIAIMDQSRKLREGNSQTIGLEHVALDQFVHLYSNHGHFLHGEMDSSSTSSGNNFRWDVS